MTGRIVQAGDIPIRCAYVDSNGDAVTGLTVTVSVYRLRSGSYTQVVTGATAPEIGLGGYGYTISSALVQAGDEFFYRFNTAGSVQRADQHGEIRVEANYTATVSGRIDAAISSRSSHTAAAVADAVLQEAIADHEGTSGSLAEFVDAIKDKTDLISSGSITVTSPIAADGTTITLYQGAAYNTTTTWQIDWENLSVPSLTGGTASVIVKRRRDGSITTYTSGVSIEAADHIRWQPTKTETDALTAGDYEYFVQVELSAGPAHVLIPVRGNLVVVEVD